ncbi:MAG: argininosuccinate lyase [Proteobacteria bacterium]|nr:argininosuccinate lyase [Pseudomonadota bacterium]
MADKKMWGGRFAEGTASSVEEYTESQSFDRVLFEEDIQGSMAHARMLARQGVLTSDEAEAIVVGLGRVRDEIESGEFVWRRELEDVHMNIESRLTEIIGPLGGKLHTGRSRNDQVGLDFRLHVARRLDEWRDLLAALVSVLVDKAHENRAVLLPGCTHFQPAQPVSLAHHLLAYAQMFKRDHQRAGDCAGRTRISPLGAAALAGTTYPLDPASVAEELGMDGAFANSLDAVSDRDFAIEAVFDATLIMAHLSRLCEEIIIWANPAFGFVALPDAFTTGSSIMPQKKNPDVAELMRGKTGRVYGSLTTLLTLVKGLPLAYNRDMQEDKEPFFDADRTVRASLSIMADMLQETGFNADAMRAALSKGFLNATELADYLVGKGLPFREAHHVSGAAVGYAERAGKGLEDLSLDELRSFSALIDQDVMETLKYETAVARREAPGGTGPNSVDRQISDLTTWLDSLE